jgi:uroporphyrinogen decarboxylase-like protein
MIRISGTLSKAWMHEALGVAFDREYYFDPAKRHAVDCACNDYAAHEFPGMGLFYSESNLGRLAYYDRRQVLIGGIQPNMILGMLLGAEFVPAEGRDADITPNCLAGREVADLPEPESLVSHELVRLFDEQISQVQSDKGRQLEAIPPFFWDASGRAAIHGVLTSAQKLWGEAVFVDMMTEPGRCEAIMAWIADAYVVLCRHFAEMAGVSITDVHVGECSCCMVSPALAEQFVVPATSRIGRALGPVRLHSCGASTHLLEAFAGIENLGSLDLGGETSIGKAREIFGREMWISVIPSPSDMSAESTEPILDWARRMLAENDGGHLEYVYHLDSGYNVEAIRALTDFVRTQPDFEISAAR